MTFFFLLQLGSNYVNRNYFTAAEPVPVVLPAPFDDKSNTKYIDFSADLYHAMIVLEYTNTKNETIRELLTMGTFNSFYCQYFSIFNNEFRKSQIQVQKLIFCEISFQLQDHFLPQSMKFSKKDSGHQLCL